MKLNKIFHRTAAALLLAGLLAMNTVPAFAAAASNAAAVNPTSVSAAPAEENTVDARLDVVNKAGAHVAYTAEVKGSVMVYTIKADAATLTGNLQALKDLSVNTIRFVTLRKSSTATVSTVCSGGTEGDSFTLAHDGAHASLVVNNADHSNYLS